MSSRSRSSDAVVREVVKLGERREIFVGSQFIVVEFDPAFVVVAVVVEAVVAVVVVEGANVGLVVSVAVAGLDVIDTAVSVAMDGGSVAFALFVVTAAVETTPSLMLLLSLLLSVILEDS
eukprot:2375136-Ditylum_brightwellii.AAC.1